MSELQQFDEEERERLRGEMEAQRHLFQAVLDAVPAGIAIFDGRDLRVKWANPTYHLFLEEPYRSGEITGLHLHDFIPGAAESGLAGLFRRVVATGQPWVNPEYEHLGFARGVTYWRGSALPLVRKGGGAPPDVMILVVEITEQVLARKRAEELAAQAEAERARLKAIIDSAPEAIIVIDERCRILLTNPVADRLYVHPTPYGEDFRNNPGVQVYYPDGTRYHPRDLPLVRAALDGETHTNIEVVALWPDGQRCDLLINTAPIRDSREEVIGAVGIFQGITHMKETDRERQRLLKKLQETNERLESQTKELLAQREKLAEADRSKDEFLAMLSHELRNPLGALSNVVQVLHLHGANDSTCGQVHAILERQVQHMARLLDDLLDVSRITLGKIELHKEPVDLIVAVAHAIETTRPFIEARRHELEVSLPAEPVWLEADPTRLEQILINLLNNAAKYTEPGGHIWLTAEREGDEGVLRVRDSGVGISPELVRRVFDLFMQGDRSPDRSQGGLGIGLTLVRSLAEMHGGGVQVCSAGLGQGSEFAVRLPAMPARVDSMVSDARSVDPERETRTSRRRILVVDDNVDAAKMLAMLLEMWGHQVWVAHDGPAAIEVAMSYRPAVVLLDIGLPRMDGYELARRLRQQVGLSEAMLVALTGYGHEEARRRSQEAGFDHHLVKPIGSGELRRLLTAMMEGL